jgi:hypothetical protein
MRDSTVFHFHSAAVANLVTKAAGFLWGFHGKVIDFFVSRG